MRLLRFGLVLAGLVLVLAGAAKADTVTIDGTYAFANKGNQTAYLEMAWLITQMMSTTDQLRIAKDQYAIWSLSGGPNPYGTNSTLVAAALAAVAAGFTGQGWEILTPTGSTGQEFLIRVPEPAELLMLLIGLIVLGIATRKTRVARAHTT